jgi:hypothetical protein
MRRKMLTKIARAIENPLIIRRKLRGYLDRFVHKRDIRKAALYSQEHNLEKILQTGASDEIPPITHDLVNLHREIRQRLPKAVLEIGVGFSTIVMCDALHRNALDGHGEGKLWTIDTSEKWIENTRKKLPQDLEKYCEFVHGKAVVRDWNGELCHTFEELPNITPDMIYLDGPYGPDIKNTRNGLGFSDFEGKRRSIMSADVLLFENTLDVRSQFFLIVDGRYNNVQFLKRNLKRKYRFREYPSLKCSSFELLE